MSEQKLIALLDEIIGMVQEVKNSSDHKKRTDLLSETYSKLSSARTELAEQDPQYRWRISCEAQRYQQEWERERSLYRYTNPHLGRDAPGP